MSVCSPSSPGTIVNYQLFQNWYLFVKSACTTVFLTPPGLLVINLIELLRLLHTPFWKASMVFWTKAALIFVSCWWISARHLTLSSSKVPVRHGWQVLLLEKFLINGTCSFMSVTISYSRNTHLLLHMINTHQTMWQHQAPE